MEGEGNETRLCHDVGTTQTVATYTTTTSSILYFRFCGDRDRGEIL